MQPVFSGRCGIRKRTETRGPLDGIQYKDQPCSQFVWRKSAIAVAGVSAVPLRDDPMRKRKPVPELMAPMREKPQACLKTEELA